MDNATQSALGIGQPINPAPPTPPAPASTPTEASVSQQAGALQQKMSGIQSQADKSMAELKPTHSPDTTFHQLPPKDTSELAAVMMVLGALGGRSTMTPMTAALNNITAVMKGQHEGNQQMVDAQRKEFQMNFDNALKAHQQFMDEKQAILQKYHYDMAAAADELKTLQLQHGISDAVMKHNDTKTFHDQQAAAKAAKLASDLNLVEKKIASTGSVEAKKLEAKYRSQAEAELAKTTDPAKIALINDRLMQNLKTLDVAAAPKPAESAAIPPRPSAVPSDAKYSPSNKSWWWQVNGEWHSSKSE